MCVYNKLKIKLSFISYFDSKKKQYILLSFLKNMRLKKNSLEFEKIFFELEHCRTRPTSALRLDALGVSNALVVHGTMMFKFE